MRLELSLGDSAKAFDLEEAVCSHGLFMMSPNRWDSESKSLIRPLRLESVEGTSRSSCVMVRISQANQASFSNQHSHLIILVEDVETLSLLHQQVLLGQIRRMLRLSELEKMKLSEFQKFGFHGGRIFRSPTLFEDMVKCILLCNCQSLTMARALCELQLELNPISFGPPSIGSSSPPIPPANPGFHEETTSHQISASNDPHAFGNFPSPDELADLDEEFLTKRCGLGYRAARILNLAKSIVNGSIQPAMLEEISEGDYLSSYGLLSDQLGEIDGFGPFTRANVLMCMGFYHVIPVDSETIRHLKQFHGKKSTAKTIGRDLEAIYGRYAPFQFLVYWSEVWRFYEAKFGKLSEMPRADYKLITAHNMRGNLRSITKHKQIDM